MPQSRDHSVSGHGVSSAGHSHHEIPHREGAQKIREQLAALLDSSRGDLSTLVAQRVMHQAPEYQQRPSAALHKEITAAVNVSLTAISEAIRSPETAIDSAVAERAWRIAQERARQGYSLAHSLQTYQIGARVILEWGTQHPLIANRPDFISELASSLVRYVEVSSTAAAEAFNDYHSRTSVQLRQRERDDIERLVFGDLASDDQRQILTHWGFSSEGPLTLLYRTKAPAEIGLQEDPSQEMAIFSEEVRKVLAATGVANVVSARHFEMIALLDIDLDEATSPALWTRLAATTAGRRTVVCGPLSRHDLIRPAYELARTGHELLQTGKPLCRVREIPLLKLLLHQSLATSIAIAEAHNRKLLDEVRNSHRLAETVTAFLDAGLNVKRAAAMLQIHPNTFYYRLERIREDFGIASDDLWGLLDIFTLTGMTTPERGDL